MERSYVAAPLPWQGANYDSYSVGRAYSAGASPSTPTSIQASVLPSKSGAFPFPAARVTPPPGAGGQFGRGVLATRITTATLPLRDSVSGRVFTDTIDPRKRHVSSACLQHFLTTREDAVNRRLAEGLPEFGNGWALPRAPEWTSALDSGSGAARGAHTTKRNQVEQMRELFQKGQCPGQGSTMMPADTEVPGDVAVYASSVQDELLKLLLKSQLKKVEEDPLANREAIDVARVLHELEEQSKQARPVTSPSPSTRSVGRDDHLAKRQSAEKVDDKELAHDPDLLPPPAAVPQAVSAQGAPRRRRGKAREPGQKAEKGKKQKSTACC